MYIYIINADICEALLWHAMYLIIKWRVDNLKHDIANWPSSSMSPDRYIHHIAAYTSSIENIFTKII